MADRRYVVTVFKDDGAGKVYGAKTFTGTLDRACKRLIKLFGFNAPVRAIGPGQYSVGPGRAELRMEI